MRIRVVLEREGETKDVDIPEDATVRDIIKMLELHPEAYVPTVDGRVVPDDFTPSDGQEIHLVKVVSGG